MVQALLSDAHMSSKKPLLSIRAEPISDDDFDIESRALAEEYAEAREKGSNVKTRRQGMVGKHRSKQSGASYQRRGVQNKVGTESIDSSDDDDGEVVVRRKRKGLREEMAYEGQVVLEFNPLYRLAGLSEPKKGQEDEAPSLKNLISSHKREALMANPSLRASETSASNVTSQKEKEGSSDIEILSDEEVFGLSAEVVTQNPEPRNASPSPTDEIFDSDEVVFQPVELKSKIFPPSKKIQSSSPVETPISSQSSYVFWNCDNIPSHKPNFPMDDQQLSVKSFILDQETKDIKIPTSINRFLREYQRAGAKFLYDAYKQGKGAVLGDDMGLGKTVQVISFLSAIMRKTGTYVDHQRRKRTIRESAVDVSPRHWPTALIICPKSLISNWCRELDIWGYFEYAVWKSDNWRDVQQKFLHGYLDLMIVSYDVARLDIQHIKDLPLSAVIVDEAHRLKEPMSQTTLALKSIQCQVCFALTGTLVQNRIDEMWSVLDFVHRGWAGTYRQWKEFAVSPIKKGHQVEGTAAEVVRAIMTIGVMTQRILPHFYLRRDKRLIAHELPEKKDLVVFCPLASRQIVAYRALIESDDVVNIQARNRPCPCGSGKRAILCCEGKEHNSNMKEILFQYLSALRKVANHFGLLYDHKDDNRHTRMVNRKLFKICTGHEPTSRSDYTLEEALDPENCGKWNLLKKLLIQWRNEPVKNKVLIFSSSVRLLKIISRFISTSPSLSGFEFDALTGEASGAERQEMIDRFQDLEKDHFIMLISTRAGGVGLNLTAANKVVIFDPSWNPADDLQAMDRAFRIGQKRTVEVYRLIGQGTIEELIYERQVQKQQSARQLNNGTLEPRIYQGYDRATNVKDQAELFGVHNLFLFDPNGFAPANLGVHVAKDNFLEESTSLTENEGEVDEVDEDEDIKSGIRAGSSRTTSQSQRHREGRKKDKGKEKKGEQMEETADMVQSLLEDAPTPPQDAKEVDILTELGFNSLLHENAFGDSAEEREIFEKGLKILENNPMLAKSIKANSLTKTQRRTARKPAMALGPGLEPIIRREPKKVKKESKRSRLMEGHEDEGVGVRREKRRKGESSKNLVELSD